MKNNIKCDKNFWNKLAGSDMNEELEIFFWDSLAR